MRAEVAKNSIVRDDLGPPSDIGRYLVLSERDLARFVGTGRLVTDNNAFFPPTRDAILLR